MWIFLIVSTLAWGIAEIFYKKGSFPNEKYSHLKIVVFVGFFMGIYATVIACVYGLFGQIWDNFLRYLPVALCYILSMTFSYFGVKYIKESVADPIENSSCAVVPILCAIFLRQQFPGFVIFAIVLVAIGLILISIFDKKEKEQRKVKLGKKLAVFAFAMPFCYLVFDAIGTFLDILFVDDFSSTLLVGVTEENIEHVANCIYEYTFFIFAILVLIFIVVKGEKLFFVNVKQPDGNIGRKIINQRWKILAAIFETIGQSTYLFALSSGGGIAAVILGSGTAIVSLLLSRIFLKEKLSIAQYASVFVILAGIVILSVN